MPTRPFDDRDQIATLARRLGQPRLMEVELEVSGLFDPVNRTDRSGEVAFLLLRPDGRTWLMLKEHYPEGAYRIPTGGVKLDELVDAALAREVEEETGFLAEPERFLAAIHYRLQAPEAEAYFATYLFLVPCQMEPPLTSDPEERVAGWRTVGVEELPGVADFLERVPSQPTPDYGDWRDWGRFRAVVHRVAYETWRRRGDAGTRRRGD